MADKKTCLIIGNGPSLSNVPNEFLSKYPSFGSNRLYLKFTPDYYSFVDRLSVGNYIEDIKQLECKEKFIRHNYADKVPGSHPIYQIGGHNFSFSPLAYVCGGQTITYVNLQLAYFYGFERVGLIGIDHEYKPNPQGKDVNHFTTDYYTAADTFWAVDATASEPAYLTAKSVYEADGREIINLTDGGKLSIFDREDWRLW